MSRPAPELLTRLAEALSCLAWLRTFAGPSRGDDLAQCGGCLRLRAWGQLLEICRPLLRCYDCSLKERMACEVCKGQGFIASTVWCSNCKRRTCFECTRWGRLRNRRRACVVPYCFACLPDEDGDEDLAPHFRAAR